MLSPFFFLKLTLASLIPLNFVLGLSNTRKAAKLAVYEATIIIAKPAQTIPKTLAEKLLGVPTIEKHNNQYSIQILKNFSLTFSYSAVKQHPPCKPNRTR